MSNITLHRTVQRIGGLQIAIIVLAVITALIHLERALVILGMLGGGHHMGARHAGGARSDLLLLIVQNLPLLFILNCIGYIVLVVALYLPVFRRWQRIIRWLLIVFTAITIIAYFALLGFVPNSVGYADKVIELALVVLLLIEDWRIASASLEVR